MCSIKKLFLKISQYSQENTFVGVSINKVPGLRPVTLSKRDSNRYFPVNIEKFLITPILKNICERLLLQLIHGSKPNTLEGSLLNCAPYPSLKRALPIINTRLCAFTHQYAPFFLLCCCFNSKVWLKT